MTVWGYSDRNGAAISAVIRAGRVVSRSSMTQRVSADTSTLPSPSTNCTSRSKRAPLGSPDTWVRPWAMSQASCHLQLAVVIDADGEHCETILLRRVDALTDKALPCC